MKEAFQDARHRPGAPLGVRVDIATRSDLEGCRHWLHAFSHARKDRRYYELVEDTIRQGFDYRYFMIKDGSGNVCAIQPFFLLDQDLLAAGGASLTTVADAIRRVWPSFMRLRTLMVGCAAGEGNLDRDGEFLRCADAQLLADVIKGHARDLGARLIVLKEFPAEYRSSLHCFVLQGYTRIPSLPMVSLEIDCKDFEDYMDRKITRRMRSHLRRKFRHAARAAPIEMSVTDDLTPVIDDVYPLYLQVYERSALRFEMLTKDYLCRLGRLMPDKVRFFVWRQSGKIIAFSVALIDGDAICHEYIGLDYSVALRLHLYFYAFRDTMCWSMINGYRYYLSTGLVYDPKWQLRFQLHPLDLYVLHTSRLLNVVLKWVLPLLAPTWQDTTLLKFANYDELWGDGSPKRTSEVDLAEDSLGKAAAA